MKFEDSFHYIAESHKAFMDLAKQYMEVQADSDDFASYREEPSEAEVELSEDEADMEQGVQQDAYLYDDPICDAVRPTIENPYAKHFSEADILLLGLDAFSSGIELGLPNLVWVGDHPRGRPDEMLPIIRGKYTEL